MYVRGDHSRKTVYLNISTNSRNDTGYKELKKKMQKSDISIETVIQAMNQQSEHIYNQQNLSEDSEEEKRVEHVKEK